MNQIILDVEWYESKNVECKHIKNILQIGAVKINDNGDVQDNFYSIICPEDISLISDETYEFMHLSKQVLINSKPLKVVLKEFQEWCGFNSYAVVLNMSSVNVLKKAYLIEEVQYPFIGSITVQELYVNYLKLDENVKFLNMCYNLDIEVNADKLHLSSYDVILCMKVYLKIRTLIIEAVHRGIKYDKLYAVSNEKYRVLHKINCGSITGELNNYYIISFINIDEKRFTICKKCIMYDVSALIMRNQKLNDHSIGFKSIKPWFFTNVEIIRTMCDEEGYRFYINGSEIFIDTGVSWWRFKPNSKVIKLYHSNDVYDFSPYGDDYHLQERSFPDTYQAVMYIIAHDTTKFARLKNTKRQKIN